MAEFLAVVSKVRQRVVDLADQQILTIIETSHRFFHTADSTAFSRSGRPSKSLLRESYLRVTYCSSFLLPSGVGQGSLQISVLGAKPKNRAFGVS
jgi:hypothetical protein